MKRLHICLVTTAAAVLFAAGCIGRPPQPEFTGKTPGGDSFVLIKGGKYKIGDNRGESDEKPEHDVILKDFYIGKFEVTNAEFGEFVRAGGYEYHNEEMMRHWPPEGLKWLEEKKITKPYYWGEKNWDEDNQPVAGVSWYEAAAYASWRGCRLPTNDEWEAAARGKERRRFPWGNELPEKAKDYLNCWRLQYDRVTPVGSFDKGRTPEGVYDMAGNVMEWVSDWYVEDYYTKTPSRGPENRRKPPFPQKTIRGGSFDNRARFCTTYRRYGKEPEYRWVNVGFRLAKDKK